MYYDGACPLCLREVRMLKRRDRNGCIRFVDFADPRYEAEDPALQPEKLARTMHVQTADGTLLRGMSSFRAIYRAIGRGWLAAPTGWPVLKQVFDGLYWLWAKCRPHLPGRCKDGTCEIRS